MEDCLGFVYCMLQETWIWTVLHKCKFVHDCMAIWVCSLLQGETPSAESFPLPPPCSSAKFLDQDTTQDFLTAQLILTCKIKNFITDEKPEKCFITVFYNDNKSMLKSYLHHLTVDSILLTSQEMSVTQDHLEYACTCVHQGKRRPRNNLCNWGQLAQRCEILKAPEVILGACGSLSDCILSVICNDFIITPNWKCVLHSLGWGENTDERLIV